ncbi:MAG: hypothetical protein AAGG48_18315 [Planctomycetota bacterium]
MWRDLVWDWQRYFGKSACIGVPTQSNSTPKTPANTITAAKQA